MSSVLKNFALFITLISERPYKAEEIKEKLGINPRTSVRYAKVLRETGYDIKSSPGPGGGYWLIQKAINKKNNIKN